MNVTVFGGSQPGPDSPAYREAYELGRLLAASGHTVLTGGYIGTMEAVSRGAAEAGGHVIGVTCEDIERWRPVKANRWVQEEIRYKRLPERVMALIEKCDAAIALPGGPGTLTEVSMLWNLLLTGGTTPRPLILVGQGWQEVIGQFLTSFDAFVPPEQRLWLKLVDTVEEAAQLAVDTISADDAGLRGT